MKKWDVLTLIGLLFLVAGIYASIGSAPPLTWDDGSNIFGNPYFTLHHWWGVLTEPYYGLYVPVTSSVWALLYTLGQGQAWPFRAFNVAIHCTNIVLVFFLLRGLARRLKVESPWSVMLATGVFALHPLQVESVAWISGGRDLLAGFFALAATLVYFTSRGRAGYVAATLFFALGLLSKPSVVVLPAAILALDVLVEKHPWRASFMRMLPWFFFSLAAVYLTQGAQVGHFENTVSWWQRPLVMLDSYLFYIQKFLWPNPLSGNYAHLPEKLVSQSGSILRALGFALLVIAAFWLLRKRRSLQVLLALWLLFFLPVSGLVPFAYENISGVADHYNYLPLVCAAAMLMVALDVLLRRRILVILPLLVLGTWSYVSWARLIVWESDLNFFMDMAKVAPESYNTAIGMSMVMCQDVKDYEQGIKWTDKALALHENDILALANRAFCLSAAGRPKEVIAMDYYLSKIDVESLAANQPTAYSSLLASIGSALFEERDYEDGFQYLCEAYRVKPAEPNHLKNLQAATEILKQHGLEAQCEEESAEPAEEDPGDLIHQLIPPAESEE